MPGPVLEHFTVRFQQALKAVSGLGCQFSTRRHSRKLQTPEQIEIMENSQTRILRSSKMKILNDPPLAVMVMGAHFDV